MLCLVRRGAAIREPLDRISLYFMFLLLAVGLPPQLLFSRRQFMFTASFPAKLYSSLDLHSPFSFLLHHQLSLSPVHHSQHTHLAAALGCRWAHNDSNYRRSERSNFLFPQLLLHLATGHPLPFPDEERGEGNRGNRDPHQWSWLPLYTAVAVLAYLLTSSVEPVPEISFPFFLQHMLYAGEVS